MPDTTTDNAPADAAPDAPALSKFTAAREAEGFAIADGYPLNHRLRAEAMALDGVKEDPAGHVAPELIAETGERLAAEALAEESDADREGKRLRKLNLKELQQLAAEEVVAVEGDANKATIVKAIEEARAARSNSEG